VSTIDIRVYGLPAAQGSKRHLGRGVMVESSKRVKPWRSDVVAAALAAYDGPLIEGAVSVSVVFLFARPKGHFGKRGLLPSAPLHLTSQGAGDLDKLCRSTLDGLSAAAGGSLLRDDSQVVTLTANKRYCVGEERPGALICVMPCAA
jgi:crossover junction endodeoxyribonuclease RusA